MLPRPLQDLIDEISSLPGIGPKSATRIALDIIKGDQSVANKIGNSIASIHDKISECKLCGNYSELELCSICDDYKRNSSSILVVESPLDILAFEKSDYNGVYHVLGGLISPMSGIGPDGLLIESLCQRLLATANELGSEIEVILACPTSLEGEATTTYIHRRIDELTKERGIDVNITELARGIPANASAEYLDPSTLNKSLDNRRSLID